MDLLLLILFFISITIFSVWYNKEKSKYVYHNEKSLPEKSKGKKEILLQLEHDKQISEKGKRCEKCIDEELSRLKGMIDRLTGNISYYSVEYSEKDLESLARISLINRNFKEEYERIWNLFLHSNSIPGIEEYSAINKCVGELNSSIDDSIINSEKFEISIQESINDLKRTYRSLQEKSYNRSSQDTYSYSLKYVSEKRVILEEKRDLIRRIISNTYKKRIDELGGLVRKIERYSEIYKNTMSVISENANRFYWKDKTNKDNFYLSEDKKDFSRKIRIELYRFPNCPAEVANEYYKRREDEVLDIFDYRNVDARTTNDAIIAYLRHRHSNYDLLRSFVKEDQEAYEILKDRTNKLIECVIARLLKDYSGYILYSKISFPESELDAFRWDNISE